MFEQIVFARIEFSGRQQNRDGLVDLSGGEASPLRPEGLKFVSGVDGCCYGYAMPMGQEGSARRPRKHDGWLVLFVAPEDALGTARLRTAGWYEEACFARSYQHRPEPELQRYVYIVTTQAQSAYQIPIEKRQSFPNIPNDHFARNWMYARSPLHSGNWRERLAELAEQIVRRKSECTRIG